MTTEFPGADFAVDYASYLSAYELIAQMPLRNWTAGLPLGNGDLSEDGVGIAEQRGLHRPASFIDR